MTEPLVLFGAMFYAPLGAVSKRWPNTIHAVEMKQMVEGWKRGTFQSACGKTGLRLVSLPDQQGMLFPPRLKGMPDGLTRCKACYDLTGKKRPRTEFVQKEGATV